MEKVHKSEREWREQLTPEQYHVLRERGTEPAYGNRYWNEHRKGGYVCPACGQLLFRSETKYDSGTGWPSFRAPADPEAVETRSDRSQGLDRTEVVCSRCGGHLGHLFEDGPAPTGKRYCMNSAALEFREDEEGKRRLRREVCRGTACRAPTRTDSYPTLITETGQPSAASWPTPREPRRPG